MWIHCIVADVLTTMQIKSRCISEQFLAVHSLYSFLLGSSQNFLVKKPRDDIIVSSIYICKPLTTDTGLCFFERKFLKFDKEMSNVLIIVHILFL